jgi:hypothetical protein
VQNLLGFEVLLADAEVELGEPRFVEPVALPKQPPAKA